MTNKGLKITAIVLGIVAIAGVVYVNTSDDIQRGIQRRERQEALNQRKSSSSSSGSYSSNSKWQDNRLSNGSQPYSQWYGYNYSCDEWGCSQIKVTAPTSSDVVVLVKRNNKDGNVVRHAYIRSGCTYTFEVSDGRYQVFFYYGTGWNPEKSMSGGIKGGFVSGETFSKDDPQYLEGEILTYVLQLRKNGNLHTKHSSAGEMF